MSSLGFQLVYSLLNEREELVCERFFRPDRNEPLRSLESQRSLKDFPLLFISISFEHDYQNLVALLLEAGIEPYAENREERVSSASPLVICGGVATFMNPEPVAPFIDLFLIGEAEPLLGPVADYLHTHLENSTRSEILHYFGTTLQGCYVPSRYHPQYDNTGQLQGYRPEPGFPDRVVKRVSSSAEVAAHSQLTSPAAEFSEMHLTELGRGCSRGCRFCAAGFIYRPPRLWDGDAVVAGLRARFENIDKVGLLGMEMAKTASLEEISSYLQKSGCALSFSSLRADRLSPLLIELLSQSGLRSVAIAPDGTSERLRRVINKGLQESDLLAGAEKLVQAGIFKLKLYLMIGLPTETDDDLQEAVELIGKMKETIDPHGKKRGRLTEIVISVNCFAPKPWTPFQYHPFGMEQPLEPGDEADSRKIIKELKRKQKVLKTGFGQYPNVHAQFDKPENVLFQAVLARGDRRLAQVLLDMCSSHAGWKRAMASHNLSAEQFTIRGTDHHTWFPWYLIDHKIDHDFLWREYQRSFTEKLTEPCNTEICRRCGVCHD